MLKTVDFNRSINPAFLVQHPFLPPWMQDRIRSYLPVLNAFAHSRSLLAHFFLCLHSASLPLECVSLISGQKDWDTFKSEIRKTVTVVCRLMLSIRHPYLYLISSETYTLIAHLQQFKKAGESTKLPMLLMQSLYLFSLLGESPSWKALEPALLDKVKKGLGEKKLSAQKVWESAGIVPTLVGAKENVKHFDFYNSIILICRIFQALFVAIHTTGDVNLKALGLSDMLTCARIALRCTTTDCFNQAIALFKPRGMWWILPMIKWTPLLPLGAKGISLLTSMIPTTPNASTNYHIGAIGAPVQMDDIIGCKKAKKSLLRLVDRFVSPNSYQRLGLTSWIKGILFYGPPGTGKSMLAKAFATAVGNAIFLEQPGSSFIEIYVGQGPQNIRKLFDTASKFAEENLQRLVVVFIDEINGIGARRRTDGLSSTHREEASTTEAFLVAMDSMPTNVVVIGATNARPEDLDPAFVRSGRFDEHIEFKLPTGEERLKILAKHSVQYRVGQDVNEALWENIARQTEGWCYADFTNLMKQAALKAGYKKLDRITKRVYQKTFNQLKRQRPSYYVES